MNTVEYTKTLIDLISRKLGHTNLAKEAFLRRLIWLITKSSSAARCTRRWLGNTITCPYGAFQHITKSSSGAGHTRCRLGNTSTCPYSAFQHITKSSSDAGCTRCWLRKTSTCPYGAFRHITKSSSAARCTRLCYMLKRTIWTSACVTKPMSGASYSWWWLCYMSIYVDTKDLPNQVNVEYLPPITDSTTEMRVIYTAI